MEIKEKRKIEAEVHGVKKHCSEDIICVHGMISTGKETKAVDRILANDKIRIEGKITAEDETRNNDNKQIEEAGIELHDFRVGSALQKLKEKGREKSSCIAGIKEIRKREEYSRKVQEMSEGKLESVSESLKFQNSDEDKIRSDNPDGDQDKDQCLTPTSNIFNAGSDEIRKKVLKAIILLTSIYIAKFLPYVLMSIYRLIYSNYQEVIGGSLVDGLFYCLFSSINPFIYGEILRERSHKTII